MRCRKLRKDVIVRIEKSYNISHSCRYYLCVPVLSFVYSVCDRRDIQKESLRFEFTRLLSLTQFLSQIPCTCLPECFV